MTKRVAFLISKQHFIIHGGIGQFAKGFGEMAEREGWIVDYITDGVPTDSSFVTGRIVIQEGYSYKSHRNAFPFGEGLNAEQIANFRDGLLGAYKSCFYDMIVCNNPESAVAAYSLGLAQNVAVIFYTHLEVLFGKSSTFSKAYTSQVRAMCSWPDLVIGTQSKFNTTLVERALFLPMPVPEQDLLKPSRSMKSGVLFTGRHEARKNPELFLSIVAKTGLPVKILTGGKNAQAKWEAGLKKHGIKDYEIRVGIVGKEKVEFIKSAKAALHTAKLESFGFSAFETIHSCPTLLLEEYPWTKAFEGMAHYATRKTAPVVLKELYNSKHNQAQVLEQLMEFNAKIPSYWRECMFDSREGMIRSTKLYDKYLKSYRKLEDYWSFIKRKAVGGSDLTSLYNNLSYLNFKQESDHTKLKLEKTISAKL